MKKVIKIIFAASAVLVFLPLVIFWYEADKEVQILCGEISSGLSLESAEKILGTGEFLHYQKSASSQGTMITMSSFYYAGIFTICIFLFGGLLIAEELYSDTWEIIDYKIHLNSCL